MTQILESFTIPITEWKTVDAGKNTIRIKGVALKGDVVSKNNRLYVAKELMKSTNTFINKPVNLHHADPKNERTNIGTITWMDWDEKAELLTYEAEIKRQPYVEMIRNKSAEIRGVSIQANFLHNRCPDCNTRFYTEEDFRGHMWDRHFKKVSAVPHGIIGEALTLVLSPEIPGYSGTTVELSEIARVETLRLLETVIQAEKEREDYMQKLNCGVTPRPTLSVGSVAEVKNPPEKAEPQVVSAEVKEKRETPTEPASPEQPTPKPNTVQINETAFPKEQTVNVHDGLGLAKFATAETVKLKLGEPFAGYDSFEECVAANSDKENPEAYCGRIKRDTEDKETVKRTVKALEDKVNEIVDTLNKPVSVKIDYTSLSEVFSKHSSSTVEALGKLTEEVDGKIDDVKESVQKVEESIKPDDLGWKEVKPYDDTPLKELIEASKYNDAPIKELIEANHFNPATLEQKLGEIENKIAEASKTAETKISELKTSIPTAYNDQPIKEQIANIKPYDDTPLKTTLNQTQETLKTQITEALKPLTEKLNTIETENAKLKETIATQKTEFDTLLSTADTHVKEEFAKKQREIEEMKKQLTEKDKQLSEQTKLQETVMGLRTDLENALDKQTGKFKAHAPNTAGKEGKPLTHDPTTGRPRQ
ncbi:MAG: hypothetical protein WC325_13745 [Candidatus Bathyarchaeia archaeon]|jgi:hypothetical protein